MNPQEIAENYNKLASYWSGDQFNRENGIAQHQKALQFLSNKRNAIDIGCGSSGRFIDLMLEAGFEVEGLDISPEMLRLAKEKHPKVEFHLADICAWEFPRKYDFISAWDSIWHAPLVCHEQILMKLCDGLADGGVLIFTSGGIDRPGDSTNPCMGQPMYHAALGIPKLLEVIPRGGCICRHLEYDQYPELHIYLIVQKAAPGEEGCRRELREETCLEIEIEFGARVIRDRPKARGSAKSREAASPLPLKASPAPHVVVETVEEWCSAALSRVRR